MTIGYHIEYHILPPYYVRVVHKGFTVKLGTVVPEVVDTFPKISPEKEEK